MSATPNPPEPTEPTEDDPRLQACLFDLLEVGAKVAQSIGRQAQSTPQPETPPPTPPPNPPPTTDLAEQFERVARAMRRTVLLIRHMAQNPAPPKTQARTQARKRIIRAVEDAIQLKRAPDEAEPLRTEFRERLDAPDLDEEIDTRPVAEIITDIIRDLGLAHLPGTHPWQRRTPRDLQALQTRAAAPTPPGPHNPAPHGPDPGAPPPKHPPKPPDPRRDYREMVQLAKRLSST